jgi:hypothetical protein
MAFDLTRLGFLVASQEGTMKLLLLAQYLRTLSLDVLLLRPPRRLHDPLLVRCFTRTHTHHIEAGITATLTFLTRAGNTEAVRAAVGAAQQTATTAVWTRCICHHSHAHTHTHTHMRQNKAKVRME